MLAIVLIPVFLALQIYVYTRLILWLKACSDIFQKLPVKVLVGVVHGICSSAMYIGFLLPQGTEIRRRFCALGNFWYGACVYLIGVNLLVHLGAFLLGRWKLIPVEKLKARRTRAAAGTLCAALVTGICIGGAVNAADIRVTPYEITVNKSAGDLYSLKVLLLADLHMGYSIGCDHIRQMVEKANAQEPDVIVIAGDLFDNSYEALEDPDRLAEILGGLRARYGVYAVYGNHDIEEKILGGFTFRNNDGSQKVSDPRMDALLEQAGITLLTDEGVMIAGSVYLCGRPDYARPNRGVTVRRTPEEIAADVPADVPFLCFEHEPRELDALAEAGIDVHLAGHTHDGQLFPLNLLCGLKWENSYGYLRKGNLQSIVTSGVGIYGPFLRVGTHAEICPVTIHFVPGGESQ